ncbi:MAG: biotin/lipoyl-binding protein [Pseudomonadales bacterium]|nr:biotin/lipoyl-binding protein [Pseudomonadales bacterium]
MLALLLVWMLAGCDVREAPGLPGTLETDRIALSAEFSEPVISVLVREGDQVREGETLLALDPARMEVALQKASAELALAAARLKQAEAGPRAQDIARARAQLAATTSAEQTARIEWERERSLMSDNYSSRNNVDILHGRFEEAVARKAGAEAALNELLEGTRSEEIDAARSQYATSKAVVDNIRLSLARTTLISPVDGLVEAVSVERGERAMPGQALVILLDTSKTYARIHIPEDIRTRVNSGAAASIRIDGYDEPFRGQLRWVGKDAGFTPHYALTQKDRAHLSYLAEVDVRLEGKSVPYGVPVEVYFDDLAVSN